MVALPEHEQLACVVATYASPGHALVGVGVARPRQPLRPGLQPFFPYVRVYPRGLVHYRLATDGRAPGLNELMRGLREVGPGRPLDKQLARLRWKDLAETVTGTEGAPFVTGWWTSDLGWDTAPSLGSALDSGDWPATLKWMCEKAPLALYSLPAQRLLRAELRLKRRAPPHAAVEAALHARRLSGGLQPAQHLEVSAEDELLSRLWAIDRSMMQIEAEEGHPVFNKWRTARSRADYRACALATLAGKLPRGFDAVSPPGDAWKSQLRLASRLQRSPALRRRKSHVPAWAVPHTVAFLDEPLVCTAHPLDIAWELARWIRTRRFLAKRWVLGGGRHHVEDRGFTTFPSYEFQRLQGHKGPFLTRATKRLLLSRRDRPLSAYWAEVLQTFASPVERSRLGLPEPSVEALQSGLELLREAHSVLPAETGPELWWDARPGA